MCAKIVLIADKLLNMIHFLRH